MPAGAGGTVGAAAGALRTGADAAANGAEAGRGALRTTSGVAGEGCQFFGNFDSRG